MVEKPPAPVGAEMPAALTSGPLKPSGWLGRKLSSPARAMPVLGSTPLMLKP
ncbi:hypothetical protein D9M68_902400 [compost metagenome]